MRGSPSALRAVRSVLLGAALLLLSLPAQGWVNLPPEGRSRSQVRVGRWPMPENSTSHYGLGGGIDFSISADFCNQIMPKFAENFLFSTVPNPIQYVSCEEIHDSIMRAMQTWSTNHPWINFVNITNGCRLEDGCKPELEILTGERLPEMTTQVAAFVEHNPRGKKKFKFDPLSTAGVQTNGDWAYEHARMTFTLDICWYVDNTFCVGFHQALVDFASTTTVVRVVLFILWDIAAIVLAFRFGRYAISFSRGGWDAVSVEMDRTESKLWQSLFMIFFLIAPPAFYFRVYVPCVECYDFEATVAHEVGHVLGFTHPDEFPDLDRAVRRPMSKETCEYESLFDALEDEAIVYTNDIPDVNDWDVSAERVSSNGSVMYSLTTARARTCLTPNDLDGLHYLYPECEERHIRAPPSLCVKSKRNIGWLRLGVTIAIPFFLSVLIVITVSELLHRRLRRRASSLKLQEAMLRQAARRRISDMEAKQKLLKKDNDQLRRERHSVEALTAALQTTLQSKGIDVSSAGTNPQSGRPQTGSHKKKVSPAKAVSPSSSEHVV